MSSKRTATVNPPPSTLCLTSGVPDDPYTAVPYVDAARPYNAILQVAVRQKS